MSVIKSFFFFAVWLSVISVCNAADIKSPHRNSGIKFTENKNQWDKNILFQAQLDGGLLFLEKNCFTYNFYDKETLRKSHNAKHKEAPHPIRTHAFRMTFLNASDNPIYSSKSATEDYSNFFLGQDKSKWAGNVKNYKEVNFKELYDGINLQILGLENTLKYNFIVSPGANTDDIQLFYEGLDNIELLKGALRLKTSLNEMMEEKPYAYQVVNGKKTEVPCAFVLEGTTVHFKFPKGYNKKAELVIDPVLVFACSSGSIADNFGMTATYDAEGNLYSGGTVFGVGYPVTLGAFDPTWNGGAYLYGRTDVVITKYDSSGTFLRYSTYIGGNTGTEVVTSLVVNAQDELILYGATGSTNFPVTSNAFDQTFNGGVPMYFYRNGTYYYNGTDIYISRFNSSGTALLASTYIGGSLNDGVNYNNDSVLVTTFFDPALGNINIYEAQLDSLQYNYGDQYRGEINVDAAGNVYIASSTRSGDFPVVNGLNNSLGGKQDAVVLKLNPNFSQVLWSTFLGGSKNDAGYALALDDSLNVVVTGGTCSSDFPVTAGAVMTSNAGGTADGYVAKIKNDGSSILNASYWGTNAYDQSYFVQLDKNDNVYIVGQTEGVMPVTAGVYNNPNSGQFITKFDPYLSTVMLSTVFGNGDGNPDISPSAFLVDYCDNIYVSGWGGNILTGIQTFGMPITPNAVQPNTDGFNFYLFVLSANASSLLYATYFGGGQSQEHVDGGTSRFDKKGIIYQSVCAGCGGYDDFPVTPGSWPNTGSNVNHNTQNNNCNNGVFKFDFQLPIAEASFSIDNFVGCAPFFVQFDNQSTSGGTFVWDFGGGNTSTALNPTYTFNNPGTYTVQLIINNPASCNIYDTTFQYITVLPSIQPIFNYTTAPCSYQVNFNNTTPSGAVSWLWNFGDNDTAQSFGPSHVFDSVGTYNVQLIATAPNGCKDTTIVPVTLTGVPISIIPSDTICSGTSIQLNATGGVSYSWSPASTLSNPNIANPIATPLEETTYTVTIQTVNATNDTCLMTDSTTIYLKADTAAFASDTIAGCTPITINFVNLNPSTTEYLWNFGNGNTTSSVFNPSQTYTSPGIYNVYLASKDTARCAVWDTASLSITINPGIVADFDFVAVPCSGQFTFYDSSAVGPVSWIWNFDDGGTSTLQNPTHLFPAAGAYDVELISANTFGCKDTTTIALNYNGATTGISADDTICITDPGIQLTASGGFAYSWSPGATLNSAVIPNPVAHPLSTTTYTVSISTINSLGDTCLQSQSTTIYVIDPSLYPLSAIADDDTIPEGTSTIIHAITDTNFTIHWNPIDAVSNPFAFNLSVSPLETTTYTVSILDSTGCPRTASVTVYVVSMQCKPENVFVPNTFTPNNDGVNDVLYVRSNDIMELYFAVYNRWGQLVFETTDIKKGWDGNYKGMSADPAVFAWYLRAKCFNGDELRKKGNTTLIR